MSNTRPKFEMKLTGMSGSAKATGGTVAAIRGGAVQIPKGSDFKITATGMTDQAEATNANVAPLMDVSIQSGNDKVTTGDETDSATRKGNTTFDLGNTVALLVSGVGTDDETAVFKGDISRMEDLLTGESVGINGEYIMKPRPATAKKSVKVQIKRAIEDVKDRLDESDNGHFVFYYTGHFNKKIKGFKVDSKDDADVDYYLDKELENDLKTIPAKYVLLILDTCYSGSAKLGAKDDDDTVDEKVEAVVPRLWEAFDKGIQAKNGGGGGSAEKVVQWSSSLASQQSYSLKSSFFTNAIIQVITNPEEGKGLREELAPGQTHVSALQLHKYVKEHMKKVLENYNVQQLPVIDPPGADDEYFETFPRFAKIN